MKKIVISSVFALVLGLFSSSAIGQACTMGCPSDINFFNTTQCLVSADYAFNWFDRCGNTGTCVGVPPTPPGPFNFGYGDYPVTIVGQPATSPCLRPLFARINGGMAPWGVIIGDPACGYSASATFVDCSGNCSLATFWADNWTVMIEPC